MQLLSLNLNDQLVQSLFCAQIVEHSVHVSEKTELSVGMQPKLLYFLKFLQPFCVQPVGVIQPFSIICKIRKVKDSVFNVKLSFLGV